MKILITGNMGYIGPIVVKHLYNRYPEAKIIGLDTGYFAHCLTGTNIFPECRVHKQYFADVRNIPKEVFDGISSIVHLAAVSNDPMGNSFEKPTFQINGLSTANIAREAKNNGVKSFVFASSCSMYGEAFSGSRTEKDTLNPLTAYSRSKFYAEQELKKIADDSFVVTSLRFSTACGMSERLRLDLVLNDFIASAVASNQITILSDGTPWRPLIHVKDMARAIDWAITRRSKGDHGFLAVNVGRNDWNFQVKDLAEAVADVIPGLKIMINKDASPDKRSYQVDFSLFRSLAPKYTPRYDLEETIRELKEGLEEIHFNNPDFRDSFFMRLKVLKTHIDNGMIDTDLNWIYDRAS